MAFLEVNRTSMENKLLLSEEGSSMDSLLSSLGSPSVPTKLITPTPGLCIKTFTKSKEKVFINVCHTDEIPPPKGATIPMSIGSEKEVTDKSGEPCAAFDVALNSTFLNNNKNEIVMLTIINGIANKHGIDLDEDRYVILKNIKYKGKISPMNIEQRPVKQDPPKQPLISEIITKEQKVPARESSCITPEYNLIKIDGSRQFYATEIDLKDVTSKDEINLQLGEDRVYLATNGNMKYELEYHFPETVNSDLSAAEFDPVKQVTPPEICEPVKPAVKSVIEETIPPKVEEEEEEERWYLKKKAKVVTAVDDGTAVTCAAIPSYYGSFHTYYSNLCDSWVRNAAAAAGYHHPTTWPNYPPIPFAKDSKSYYFTESVPAFLTQGPPVLLHPERVVSLSQSEQFERSFQPNVALAPPAKPPATDNLTYSKLKRGVIRVKSDRNSPSPSTDADPPPPATIYYKSEQDEDVKPPRPISPVVPALPAASSPRNSPLPEPTPDNGVNSVVEQVAAVLDALSDAEDAVRQRVINLVDRLTFRIDKCENERQKFQDEILQLRTRLAQVQEENVQLFFENNQLRQQLEIKVEDKEHIAAVTPPAVSTITTPTLNTSPSGGSVPNNASYPYSNPNHSTPGISSKQPHCSPVSVITSPPPLSAAKSESSA